MQLIHRVVNFLERGLRVVERQRRSKSDEPVRMPLHELGHLVVGESGELGGDSRRACFFERRDRKHKHLRVVRESLEASPPRVQVGQ